MIDKPISLDARIVDAIKAIENSLRRLAVVVDADDCLIGTITDGDIRRHILSGGGLDASIERVMNSFPISAREEDPNEYIRDLMRLNNVLAIPLINRHGKYQSLIHLTDLESSDGERQKIVNFCFAVIMAGGEGTRLRPLTMRTPKPMVEVGGVPLLERQIKGLIKVGISRVYISVNYLSHIIEEYFGNGDRFGIEICYLNEEKKLGTAGALTLLPELPENPILVMNGDILTTSDLESFYQYHCLNDAKLTIAAIDYRVDIPYGVINVNGAYATGLVEKPSERFLCNAGIYVISPKILRELQKNTFCNMTDLIELCLSRKLPIAVFPVHEYWNDIGTPEDLEKARTHFFNTEVIK